MVRLILPKDARLSKRWSILAIALGGAFGIGAALIYLVR